ncbi:MAG TPA: alcohol dehydrogenase catalytic domain-containing protein [Candidatus Binatia bacterium]
MGAAAANLSDSPLTMRALYWDGRELSFLPSFDAPTPESTALIKVHLAGICATDLQIFAGYMAFTGVPGHEFVGSVEQGPAELIGKRVVGEINFGCGECPACRQRLDRHCPNRRVMGILNANGAFAEYVAVPCKNLHLVPENITDEEAVFVEPLAAAFEILTQIHPTPGDDVLVLGDGKLGNLCAQVLQLTGANVTALGKHSDKLSLLNNLGIRTQLLEKWQPHLFDIVVEATGSLSGFELALSAVRPRGTLVLKSTIAGMHQVSLAPLVINEINVIGSRCGPFPQALAALSAKQVSVTPLIEEIYRLDDGLSAVGRAGKRGTRKILLRP